MRYYSNTLPKEATKANSAVDHQQGSEDKLPKFCLSLQTAHPIVDEMQN
uniref:Uncharacterized protein n=1 Tax=Arundo donax TaxID=35708 RepID=A0A0A8XT61_ARUDO